VSRRWPCKNKDHRAPVADAVSNGIIFGLARWIKCVSSIPMLVNESIILPDLKPRSELRHHIELMSSRYRGLIVAPLDLVGRVDVLAVIHEVDTVARHYHLPLKGRC